MIRLRETETAELVRASSRENVVSLHFGPGGVWYDENAPQNAWMNRKLLELRTGSSAQEHAKEAER